MQIIDGAAGDGVRRGRRRGSGGGAGIAWNEPDLFVTSAHVVTGRAVTVVTADGRALRGEVLARDARRDVALVRAPGAGVPAVALGDPYAMRPGSLVFAVGHPFGIRNAVSVGVFQAVGAPPAGLGLEQRGTRAWVQADVRLGPGNSGGPLADADGRVIGVAAMVVSGLALAVPAPEVARLIEGVV